MTPLSDRRILLAMKSMLTLLFVFCLPLVTISSESAMPIARSIDGEIFEDEIRVWQELRIGRSQDCGRLNGEIASIRRLAAQSRSEGLDRDPVVARRLMMIEAMTWRKASKRWLRARLEPPSRESVDAWVVANQSRLQMPVRFELWTVYLPADSPEQASQARHLLEQIRESITTGELSFAEAARLHSKSESRYRDGFAGRVSLTDLAQELAQVINELQPGELSEVVQDPRGLHLFRVSERHEGPSRSELEAKARRELDEHSFEEAYREFREELLSTSLAQIDFEALSGPDDAVVLRFGDQESLEALQLRDLGSFDRAKSERRLEEIAFLLQLQAKGPDLGIQRTADEIIEAALRVQRRLADVLFDRLLAEQVLEPTKEEIKARWREDAPAYRQPPRYELLVARFDVSSGAAGDLAFACLESWDKSGCPQQIESMTGNELGAKLTRKWIDDPKLIELGPVAARAIRSASGTDRVLGPFRHGIDIRVVEILGREEAKLAPLDQVWERISRNLKLKKKRAYFNEVFDKAVASSELVVLREPTCSWSATQS